MVIVQLISHCERNSSLKCCDELLMETTVGLTDGCTDKLRQTRERAIVDGIALWCSLVN